MYIIMLVQFEESFGCKFNVAQCLQISYECLQAGGQNKNGFSVMVLRLVKVY